MKPEDFDNPDLVKRVEARSALYQADPLDILVFGPGETSVKGYQKRLQIKRSLEEFNKNNRVFFPEDEPFKEITDSYGVVGAEEMQVAEADLLVALAVTEGPTQEVALFCLRRENKLKSIVLVPEHFRNDSFFSAHLVACCHRPYYFTDDEFLSCNLASKVAVQEVNTFRVLRYLEKHAPDLP